LEKQAIRRERFLELLDGKRSVLFDFDGVIADSEYFHYQAFHHIFQHRYSHTINPDEYWIHWTSRGEGIAGEVRRYGLKGVDQQAVREEKDLLFYEYCRSGRIPLFKHAIDLMKMTEDKGLKTAIASNSKKEWIEAILESNSITYRPPFIIGKTAGMLSKPAPDIFLAAAAQVREQPEACLVIEDAEKGLQAAHKAGMPCIIIRNTLTQTIEFTEADLIVPSHWELLNLFINSPDAGK